VQLHDLPGLGYELVDGGDSRTGGQGVFTSPGPPIVLTRGQPVEIAVENRLPQSTSVHWHGIELESYYDGVPGWGGETFVVRFTPPRPGTFMYHTHLNDYVQLSTGLYGALIVVGPGQHYDPESDKIFVMSRGGTDDQKDPFLINGSAAPPAIELHAGKGYRFRFIMITPAPNLWVTLDRAGQHQVWSSIAKDGACFHRRKPPANPPM
jgi:FtsP/CotA-like multicopper oxidase with cupredoxin domain